MKTSIVTLSLIFLGPFGFAEEEKSISQIHREICTLASKDYSKALPSQAYCIENTEIEINSDSYSISFASCETGEWVTAYYNFETKEILIGSSGLEDDMCE